MKKVITAALSLLMLGSTFGLSAQDGVNKRVYTPEKGDFSVGVDLVPLFRTIGGAFNNSETPVGGTPFSYDDMLCRPDVSVMGKYMFSDKWGLKVDLGLMVVTHNAKTYVTDDKAMVLDPLSDKKVVDSRKLTKSGGSLMVGAEYRLGKRRVQGVFGFGALVAFSTYQTKYDYGNAITGLNQVPTSSTDSEYLPAEVPYGYRIVDARTSGANFMVGAYASAGAEWFIAPKISLGADVKLTAFGVFGNQGYVKSEGWNAAYERVETRTDLVTPGDCGFNLSTNNLGGSLYMSFYF